MNKIAADKLKSDVKALTGDKIKNIKLFYYLGNLCIEQIEFEDGRILELSGSCDNCNVDEVIKQLKKGECQKPLKNKCERCEKYFTIDELSFSTLYESYESTRYSIKSICPCCGFDKFTFEKE